MGRQSSMSPRQRDIVIGTLFGDGRLECRSRQNTARLRVHHGTHQKELVFWKYQELKNLVSAGPREIRSGHDPKRDKDHYSCYFHTRTTKELGKIHQIFYLSNGRKILPNNFRKLLSPLSIAVWYMDDGCNDRDSVILNTQNFNPEEHNKLQVFFRDGYQMCARIAKDRNRLRLHFDRISSAKFLSLVRRNVIPSLQYKIVPVTTDSKEEALRS